MPIQPQLVAEFPPHVRERGDQLFRDDAVVFFTIQPEVVQASVRGSRPDPYDVVIERRSRGNLDLACSCPYMADSGTPCKHVWATVRALEGMGHPLVATPGTGLAPDGQKAKWKQELDRLKLERGYVQPRPTEQHASFPEKRRVAYVLDAHASEEAAGSAVVEVMTQALQAGARWSPPRRFAYPLAAWLASPDAADRDVALLLLGARDAQPWNLRGPDDGARAERRYVVPRLAYEATLRRICETGRCFLRVEPHEPVGPVRWEGGAPYTMEVALVPHGEHRLKVDAVLVRQGKRLAVPRTLFASESLAAVDVDGVVQLVTVDAPGAGSLLRAMRESRLIAAPETDAVALATALGELYPLLPPVRLPDEGGVDVVRVPPVPHLALVDSGVGRFAAHKVDARLSFAYDGLKVEAGAPGATVVDEATRALPRQRIVQRDLAAERSAVTRLEALGAKRELDWRSAREHWRLPHGKTWAVALELSAAGWVVTLDDRAVRQAGTTRLDVRSGTDWFDLEGAVDFDGMQVGFPTLLAALRRGERTLTLPDGSVGALPDEWVARHAALAAAGKAHGDAIRFAVGQAALLDALLASMPTVEVDERFAEARRRLREFEQVRPMDAPPGFGTDLRPYQREGLGWMAALGELGVGGVLADDMGLGKTVQVLAYLERRRQAGAGPSLVVVPASIVFNWVQEARRFAPELRVRPHHGTARVRGAEALADTDVLVTTYGTLRRDAPALVDVEFDVVVLDEAQAIKNAGTATAKAARLLRARHRLAVTGTPVENRLEELWSLLEFLNPGMLGASSAFRRLTSGSREGDVDPLQVVARAVRPYILRRTKGQVARELPDRIEQTVWVDLPPESRQLYDELRDHYRAALVTRIAADGMAKSRMQVLEALLRLRQAACHPGLLDPQRADQDGGKLDVLMERLDEVRAEGHKALVFSQFTSLLALVRRRLDAGGVTYEYLDGRTRDREQRVRRFQEDPEVGLFLVSLKAGGTGLNLTAAEYVFLLDPWWNPAVEAQAIDRAHRIGQENRVIATRLVARDTVEEKVLQLQESKRELADAIVRADEGMVRGLTREDLELLLG